MFTDVSEEHTASIFGIKEQAKQVTNKMQEASKQSSACCQPLKRQ
jgi:hypothetical protein